MKSALHQKCVYLLGFQLVNNNAKTKEQYLKQRPDGQDKVNYYDKQFHGYTPEEIIDARNEYKRKLAA